MPKILTCNYCGTRAALVLDKGRHELVCASCGAPLHDIKQMPVDDTRPAPRIRDFDDRPRKTMKKKKKKKSKSRRMMSEVFDLLDDIFD